MFYCNCSPFTSLYRFQVYIVVAVLIYKPIVYSLYCGSRTITQLCFHCFDCRVFVVSWQHFLSVILSSICFNTRFYLRTIKHHFIVHNLYCACNLFTSLYRFRLLQYDQFIVYQWYRDRKTVIPLCFYCIIVGPYLSLYDASMVSQLQFLSIILSWLQSFSITPLCIYCTVESGSFYQYVVH